MKTLKIIIGVWFLLIGHISKSQCNLQDVKAFYYTPNYALKERSQKRIKISIINVSNTPNWTMTYEYGPKGFKSNGDIGVIGSYTFTSIGEQANLLIHEGIRDDQKYDFYVCGEYFGEFLDARSLLEIDVDFEYEVNRLHYIPFRLDDDQLTYPDFGNSSTGLSEILSERSNHFIDLNAYMERLKLSTHELQFLEDQIPFEVTVDYKLPDGIQCGICNIQLEVNDVIGGMWGKYYTKGFEAEPNNEWNSSRIRLTKDDFRILDEKEDYDINKGAVLSIEYIPERSLYCNYQIDNLTIRPKGQRTEICEGESVEIYGKLRYDEGIYSNSIKSVDGLKDSVEFTTLLHHPPLFINEIDKGTYEVTGNWENVEWRACGTDVILNLGKVYSPKSNKEFYVIVSDNNCSDRTQCKQYSHLGVNDVESKLISIHPNPADDIVNIVLNNKVSGKIALIDMFGRKLDERSVYSDKLEYSFNLHKITPGLYYVRLITDSNQVQSYKLVIR